MQRQLRCLKTEMVASSHYIKQAGARVSVSWLTMSLVPWLEALCLTTAQFRHGVALLADSPLWAFPRTSTFLHSSLLHLANSGLFLAS